jgi:hypothetical protein
MQVLQGTQPGLPLQKGRCGTMTQDYQRFGTSTRLRHWMCSLTKSSATANRATGPEVLKFLRRVDREFPGDVPCTW